MKPNASRPTLAPPGAGLPLPELVVARILFALQRALFSRDTFVRRLEEERARIDALVISCPLERRGERVLIPRIKGLEDSSRHWSVWMTLDHLRITNEAFAGIIKALSMGNVPPGRASTAAVKPSPEADAAVETTYQHSYDNLLRVIGSVKVWPKNPRYEHPWFGQLDASGWQALAALHMSIHRKQIERIIRGFYG